MTRWIQKDVGGTLFIDGLDERADASPTFTVYGPKGSSLGTGSATVDAVNTTLSSSALAGALSVAVASASNIAVGRNYLIGGTVDTGGEWVTVRAISGTTITLARPLVLAKASGVSFVGTRLSVAITASMVTSVARHCRVEVVYTVSAATRPTVTIAFDITRYALITGLTLERVRDIDPIVTKRASEGTVWPRLFDVAWEVLLAAVASQKNPGALVGAIDLTMPHAYAVLRLIAQHDVSEAGIKRMEMLSIAYDNELSKALAAAAIDDDQDGIIEPNEGFYRTVTTIRG